MRPVRCGLFLGLLCGLLSLGACKQGEGERCQIDSDCDGDNMRCELNGNTPAMGGFCKSILAAATDLSSTASDMAVPPPDMSMTD